MSDLVTPATINTLVSNFLSIIQRRIEGKEGFKCLRAPNLEGFRGHHIEDENRETD